MSHAKDNILCTSVRDIEGAPRLLIEYLKEADLRICSREWQGLRLLIPRDWSSTELGGTAPD